MLQTVLFYTLKLNIFAGNFFESINLNLQSDTLAILTTVNLTDSQEQIQN